MDCRLISFFFAAWGELTGDEKLAIILFVVIAIVFIFLAYLCEIEKKRVAREKEEARIREIVRRAIAEHDRQLASARRGLNNTSITHHPNVRTFNIDEPLVSRSIRPPTSPRAFTAPRNFRTPRTLSAFNTFDRNAAGNSG